MTSHESTQVVQAIALCRTWGWSGTPPESLIEHAKKVVTLNQSGAADAKNIIAGLGILTREEIDSRIHERRADDSESALACLARLYPGKVQPRVQQIFAIQSKLAYYEQIPDSLLTHEVIKTVEAARAHCESMDAVLLTLENSRPVLLFNDHAQLIRFRQSGSDQLSDPLLKALSHETGETVQVKNLLLGLAPRSEISGRLQPLRGDAKGGSSTLSTGKLFFAEAKKGERQKLLVDLIETGIEKRASDAGIEALRNGGGKVIYRINGLRTHSYFLSAEDRQNLTSFAETLSGANPQGSVMRKPTTGRISYIGSQHVVDLRCSFIPGDRRDKANENDNRTSVSVRFQMQEDGDGFVDINSLNIDPEVREHILKALGVRSGIILLIGPTNSGKSTTIGGLIGGHNQLYGDTVKRVSLEDPVERNFVGVEQFSLPDADSFTPYLEGFLRHDPDLIFIGEIRTAASAEVATRAAKTGHIVLSTFHAPSPVEGFSGVAHLMEGKRKFDLLQSLVMIIAQRLVRELCPKCKVLRAPTKEEIGRFEYAMQRLGADLESMVLPEVLFFPPHYGEGDSVCPHCNGQGTKGLIPIHGVLDFNKKVRSLLLRDEVEAVEALQAFKLEEQAFKKLIAGDISLSEACL